MKAYDLKPNYENLLKTYRTDTIKRNEDVFHFIQLLDSIDNSCSIAVDGNWGSGKTFFVKQVKMVLDSYNPHITLEDEEGRNVIQSIGRKFYGNREAKLQPQVCVYYDAWENDNDDDPVLSLVYTILNSVESDFSFKDQNCLKIAASIMEVFSGRNWAQLISNLLESTNPLKDLKGHKETEKLVGDFLESLLPEKGNRLIVIIDELDRCKPSYAVRLLERIKHYFSNDKITFVFSVNTSELQHTIKKYYGNDFDGSRYLDRFFDLRVTLPPPDLRNYYLSLDFEESSEYYDLICEAVIRVHHFELREIARFIHLTRIAAYKPTHDNFDRFNSPKERALLFSLCVFVPIMIGLKICDMNRYDDFISGKDYTPLLEVAEVTEIMLFGNLLKENENYSEMATNMEVVKLEDKLREVYETLFVNKYEKDIGRLRFTVGIKDELLRVSGLLSKYASFDGA